MALIVDGKLTIPLYHGTSDLFYESIKQFGLGGRNQIQEFRVIELLRQLVTICQTNLPNQEEWLVRMDDAERISRQGVTSGGFNFRHGSAYLTPSSFTPANYATLNEYGSEALEHFMMLWNRLRENHIELSREIKDGAHLIIAFAERPKLPLLIKLVDVPASILAAENGGLATDVFDRIEGLIQEKFFSVMCQQANFELLKPFPIRDADVFRIIEPPSDSEKALSLEPYRSTRSAVAPEA